MSYVRANGRFRGRICSGGGGACAKGSVRFSLGDIIPTGSGAAIDGDPTIALVAQLNRFAGKDLKAASYAAPRVYVRTAFPLVPILSDQVATAAALILVDRYAYAPIGTYSATKHKWAMDGFAGDSIGFVSKHLAEITRTIAEFGDRLDLPVASVGITGRADKFSPASILSNLGPVAVAGGLFLVVILATGRKR